MKYLNKRFSVLPGRYAEEAWDRIFGKCPACGKTNDEADPKACPEDFHDALRDDAGLAE